MRDWEGREPVTTESVAMLAEALGCIGGVTDVLLMGPEAADRLCDSKAEDIVDAISADLARVCGNRNRATTSPTWSDLRLVLAATLRRALEKLEEA